MDLLLLVVAKLVQKVVVQEIGMPLELSADFEVLCLSNCKEFFKRGQAMKSNPFPCGCSSPTHECQTWLACWRWHSGAKE
jgi:hypothetical protein